MYVSSAHAARTKKSACLILSQSIVNTQIIKKQGTLSIFQHCRHKTTYGVLLIKIPLFLNRMCRLIFHTNLGLRNFFSVTTPLPRRCIGRQ